MKIAKIDTPLMFDNISGSYDQMNHLLSLGLDKIWRRKFVKNLKDVRTNYNTIADIATGTGDLLVNLYKLNAKQYYAIDPSPKMMDIAKAKIYNAEYIIAKAENLPLNNNSIDLITISFGIRNFSDIVKSFSEIYRVMQTKGIVSIMEFSIPDFILFRWGFIIYIKVIIPLIIKLLSKDKEAYKYLQESIIDFNKNINIPKLLVSNNFSKINIKKRCLGAVKVYTYIKN